MEHNESHNISQIVPQEKLITPNVKELYKEEEESNYDVAICFMLGLEQMSKLESVDVLIMPK